MHWDDDGKKEACHISRLELLDVQATHAAMRKNFSGTSRSVSAGGTGGGGVSKASFYEACLLEPERTEEWYVAAIGSAVVLAAKISAIWGWANVFGREFLGREELMRLGARIKAVDHSVWEESWDDIDTLSEKDFFGGCRVHGQRTKAWFSAMHLSLAKRQGSILDVLCSC